ncbi:hypothetical protein F5Y12DRAFT_719079 [Xylaria sp. FL1777]|nr:hypothetical protein F5Y12DRAFT_719079 [Xylaria sp. FL1777]
MSHPIYQYILPATAESGEINGVSLRWQASSLSSKLPAEARRTTQSEALLKAMTEHFLYLAAHRLGATSVKITAPPHQFSIDSATGEAYQQPIEHVSADLRGGSNPVKVHVYLRGADWNHMSAVGEGVVRKGKSVIDPTLSIGNIPQSSIQAHQPASTSRASESSTARVSERSHRGSAQRANTTTSDYEARPQYSEWEQQEETGAWMRFNYTTNAWEQAR